MPPADAQPIVELVRRVGQARTRAERARVFEELARELERTDGAFTFVGRLLAGDGNAQRFALEIVSRLEQLPEELEQIATQWVGQSRFSSRLRISVAAALIRQQPTNQAKIRELIAALERKASPTRALDRLRKLATLLPTVEAVAQRLQQLHDHAQAVCPQCGLRLSEAAFAQHVWDTHRLLVDEGRVREPWQVLEGWLNDYVQQGRSELLSRAYELAQTLEPVQGLSRVHQLLSSLDTSSPRLPTAFAVEKPDAVTTCPHCFTVRTLEAEPALANVVVGVRRLEWRGYVVDLSERGPLTRLIVGTPELPVYVGPVPQRALTRRGALFFFVVPFLVLAGCFAVLPMLLGIFAVNAVILRFKRRGSRTA